MFDLKEIVRKNILNLQSYSSARDEFSSKKGIFLDANESPYGTLNRYPDPYQKGLKAGIGKIKNIRTSSIFIGNGSDEIIDLVFRIFCEPQKDKALIFTPTYGMYEVIANINNVILKQLPLDSSFQIDFEQTLPFLKDNKLKLILICSPNNPTGNSINAKIIHKILQIFEGIVIIDEAYIDFSQKPSFIKQINYYPNIIVCQTMSKAYGLAGARIGVAYAQSGIIKLLNKVKNPYNISFLNQKKALEILSEKKKIEENIATILAEKKYLEQALQAFSFVKKIYPSDANFLLIKVENADELYQNLINKGIIIRNRDKVLKNCVRITIGSQMENQQLIANLKKI